MIVSAAAAGSRVGLSSFRNCHGKCKDENGLRPDRWVAMVVDFPPNFGRVAANDSV
jgi:hypothetical protein